MNFTNSSKLKFYRVARRITLSKQYNKILEEKGSVTARTSVSMDANLLKLAKRWCKANDTEFSLVTGKLWDEFLKSKNLRYREARKK